MRIIHCKNTLEIRSVVNANNSFYLYNRNQTSKTQFQRTIKISYAVNTLSAKR